MILGLCVIAARGAPGLRRMALGQQMFLFLLTLSSVTWWALGVRGTQLGGGNMQTHVMP